MDDLARRGARQAVAAAEHRQRRQRIEAADGGPETVARVVAPAGPRRDQARLQILQAMPVVGDPRDRIRRAKRSSHQHDAMVGSTELAPNLAAQASRQLVHPPLEVAKRAGREALEARAQLAETV